MAIIKLSEIPFLDHKQLQGRFINSLLFYSQGRWNAYFPVEGGDFVEVTIHSPAEAFYYGDSPERPTDIYLQSLNWLAQHANYVDIQRPFRGFLDDVFNMTACLAKVKHLHATRDLAGSGLSRMVVTEVEYLSFLCRSVFDLFQEMMGKLWGFIYLGGEDAPRSKLKNKKKFSDVVIHEKRQATVEDIRFKTEAPDWVVQCYARSAEFFSNLRKFRDNLIHNGSQVQTIFVGESGFLIKKALAPFQGIDLWDEDERLPNDLVPLLPALDLMVSNTLSVFEDFAVTLQSHIKFEDASVPRMAVFIRSYYDEIFQEVTADVHRRLERGSLPSQTP